MESRTLGGCIKLCLKLKEAKAIIKRTKKSSKNYRKESRWYYCDFHNAWHLSSHEEKTEEEDFNVKYTRKWKKLLKKN